MSTRRAAPAPAAPAAAAAAAAPPVRAAAPLPQRPVRAAASAPCRARIARPRPCSRAVRAQKDTRAPLQPEDEAKYAQWPWPPTDGLPETVAAPPTIGEGVVDRASMGGSSFSEESSIKKGD